MNEELQALQDKIVVMLRTVYDPEIPVNIYDLGLIYDVDVDEHNNVAIEMTFTSPSCPAAARPALSAWRTRCPPVGRR